MGKNKSKIATLRIKELSFVIFRVLFNAQFVRFTAKGIV